MSFTTFLLRLVGKSPEQVKEQERFEKNMRQLDLREVQLDNLLAEIREVDQTYQVKKDVLEKTTNSVRPLVEGPDDVRIQLASEHDLSG